MSGVIAGAWEGVGVIPQTFETGPVSFLGRVCHSGSGISKIVTSARRHPLPYRSIDSLTRYRPEAGPGTGYCFHLLCSWCSMELLEVVGVVGVI
ncbi:hypothetical protein J6590_024557 [Homalodisca vitripennis]|nr:hypothetical protein J6590_024557 [Homalodisca vitripennis]